MSNRESRDEASDVGEQQPPAAIVPSSSAAEASASGTEAAKIGISSLTLADNAKAPQTPTTPSTLEAKTTGTDSEHSSVHGADEGGTKSPEPEEKARKVIAVSVSKGPSAFFNLARKFLVTDEECDLSALEGAIVSAVDAAHLLERSKIATIIKINTSYVSVEPKKRREYGSSSIGEEASGSPKTETGATSATTGSHTRTPQAIDTSSVPMTAEPGSSRIDQPGLSSSSPLSPHQPGGQSSKSSTLRRARIVITVRRTEAYVKWLKDNPIHDIHAGQDDEHI